MRADLSELAAQKRDLLGRLEVLRDSQHLTGFSDELAVLGVSRTPGVWLTGFSLAQSYGSSPYMNMSGIAHEPEYVSALIAKLRSQPRFDGYRFRELEVQYRQDSADVAFTLQGSSQDGES